MIGTRIRSGWCAGCRRKLNAVTFVNDRCEECYRRAHEALSDPAYRDRRQLSMRPMTTEERAGWLHPTTECPSIVTGYGNVFKIVCDGEWIYAVIFGQCPEVRTFTARFKSHALAAAVSVALLREFDHAREIDRIVQVPGEEAPPEKLAEVAVLFLDEVKA